MQDCKEVALLDPEEEFLQMEIPEPVQHEMKTPQSVFFGVPEGTLENTVITKIKFSESDFDIRPKKFPTLTLIKKEVFNTNPENFSGLSPIFMVVSANEFWDIFVTRLMESATSALKFLFRENYLFIPIYLTKWNDIMPQGLSLGFRNCYGSAGRLWAKAFNLVDVIVFGQSYFEGKKFWECRAVGQPIPFFWRTWHHHENLSMSL